MKVFIAVLLFATLASCYGYSYLVPASIKHPGLCYYNGHLLLKGDNQLPTACQNMKCNDDGSILVQGCGRLELPNCMLLGMANNLKPYPDCCEMNYQCTDNEGNLYTKQWNQLKDMNEQMLQLDKAAMEKSLGQKQQLDESDEEVKML